MSEETNEAFDDAFNEEKESEDEQLEEEEQAVAKPEVKRTLVPKKIEKLKPAIKPTPKPAPKEETIKQRYEVATRSPFVGIVDNLSGEAIDMASPEGLSYVLSQILNKLEQVSISVGSN